MKRKDARGFTLVELLLALSLGTMVCGVIMQALVGEMQISQRLGRFWREKTVQRRTLELVRSELNRAEVVSVAFAPAAAACGMGGRQAVLHLEMGPGQRAVTYSIGDGPSPIWRGMVLMRCGPAFGLDGRPSGGESQNRVVVDGLADGDGFTAEMAGDGVLLLSLRQEFVTSSGDTQQIQSQAMGRYSGRRSTSTRSSEGTP